MQYKVLIFDLVVVCTSNSICNGVADIFEFAQREYGLGKSTVSRFIAINEKYSEGGDSLELRKEYKDFSYSKLSEMLTLPDGELGLIRERTTTIKEIRELKNFDRQEPADEKGTDAVTQKMRSMERKVRALKKERDALKEMNLDTNDIDNKIRRRTEESVEKASDSGIMKSNKGKLKMNLQFFSEQDIYRQESGSLKRAIRKYEKRMSEQEEYLRNPEMHCRDWNEKSIEEQEGLKRHWNKEIRNFKLSIQDRVAELQKRGDYDDD